MADGWDAVVVGLGLSGLSLAAHLAASSWTDRRVLLVDDGRYDVRDRGWAFWTTDPGWARAAVTTSWQALAVASASGQRVLPTAPYRYGLVSGSRLQDLALGLVATCPRFEVVQATVDEVHDGPGHAVVQVDGTPVTTRWAFDSRPDLLAGSQPTLVFVGWEVETARPAFDPEVATFMDFRARRPGRFSFAYVLPTADTDALVEVATFTGSAGAPSADDIAADLAVDLAAYLRDVLGVDEWAVLRTESGTIPLRPLQRPRAGRHVLAIGRRGGLLKPSTGYAFERVQRDSAAIARSLDRHGHPFDVPTPRRRHAWLDRVMLDGVDDRPDELDRAFTQMFERNPLTRVLRFLDEDSTPAEEARLIATLPPGPFLRAALGR